MNELLHKIPGPILAGIAGALALVIVLTLVFSQLLYICRPNEILIFSGRRQVTPDGREVGFRVVFGGRGFRMPLVESVTRMNVSLISVPMSVSGAYSEGGIPLTLNAIANVKISTDPRVMGNAIERFLGVGRDQVARVAKETLEGHLRGVLATMTPEEVNEDRLKFAKHLEASAGPDLEKLGLHLDTLKIQHVSDDRNYLQSIGRQRIAEILRGAEIAESDAVRAAQEQEAAAAARGQVATTNAQAAVSRKQNQLRQVKGELDGQAKAEEAKAEASAQQARAVAELELQQMRGELEQLRLEAEVTIPAEIDRQVRELFAAGQAAPIAADGEAMSLSLAEVTAAWRESGGRAMDMFVLQHLDAIFGEVAKAAGRIKVREVNIMDAGDGAMVAAYASAYPQTVSALLDQVTRTLGIDVARVIAGDSTTPSRT
ncbi:MAG: flotillin family protein [Deltaproteobacteria bacterium]|nr:flotillin family protein [Deltaproteobacteria bacterium]